MSTNKTKNTDYNCVHAGLRHSVHRTGVCGLIGAEFGPHHVFVKPFFHQRLFGISLAAEKECGRYVR